MPGVTTAYQTGVHGSRPANGAGCILYSCTTHSLVYRDDGTTWTTFMTLGTSGAMTNPMTTAEDIIYGGASGAPTRKAKGSDGTFLGVAAGALGYAAVTDALLSTSDITTNNATTSKHGFLKKLSNVSTEYMDGTGAWSTPAGGGGGGSISTVVQDISADFTSGSGSVWADITGLTGISLTAGTWIAMVDLDLQPTNTYGPVFRVWDGTTTYAQAGYLVTSPVAAISNHLFFSSKPFTLGGSATMAVQYFSDTVFTVKKYPTRGAISTSVATHATFMKIA